MSIENQQLCKTQNELCCVGEIPVAQFDNLLMWSKKMKNTTITQ